MFDLTGSYSFSSEPMSVMPIIKSNIRTGEGRAKCRPLSRHIVGDQKKKVRRRIANKSKRINRR